VNPTAAVVSRAQGRLCIVLAAVLWSLNGGLKTVLTRPTSLGLHEPLLHADQIAFFRLFFAGVVLVPLLRRTDLSFRPAMLGLVVTFALMNFLFMKALVGGTAANAIILQYTAPLWLYIAGVLWMGERPDRLSTTAVALGLAGVVVIVIGSGTGDSLDVIALALSSGVAYAGVVLWLRALRAESSRWLTVLMHLGGALFLLLPAVQHRLPTAGQLGWLFLFGSVQMALPYWLMARGLRAVSASEAGTLTLLEPLLSPVWAYCVAPEYERPSPALWFGGALILAGIAYRYWPRNEAGSSGSHDDDS
jgi:drug/metabolite transporter, DME family